MSCVSAKLWLHSDIPIWAPFSWTQRMKEVSIGAIWNFTRGTGLPGPDIRLWGTKDPSKGLGASGKKGLEPNYLLT